MNQNLSSYWIFYTVANAGNISKAAKEKTPSWTAQKWAEVLPDGTIAEENSIENQCPGKCSRSTNSRRHS